MTDVLIIGSGPAGMSAAIYAKRANLNVLIAEKEYEGTGQMAESSRIDNYPGFYGINGYELGEKIREHAEALGIKFLEAEVTGIQKTEESFDITLESGEVQSSIGNLQFREVRNSKTEEFPTVHPVMGLFIRAKM